VLLRKLFRAHQPPATFAVWVKLIVEALPRGGFFINFRPRGLGIEIDVWSVFRGATNLLETSSGGTVPFAAGIGAPLIPAWMR
jgi:hypothetical protein